VLGAWALSKPRQEQPIDLAIVGVGVVPTQVLAHQPHSRIEQIERQLKRSRGGCSGRHAPL
jgi:hypothetical protein